MQQVHRVITSSSAGHAFTLLAAAIQSLTQLKKLPSTAQITEAHQDEAHRYVPGYDSLLEDVHHYTSSKYLSEDKEYNIAAQKFLKEKQIAYAQKQIGPFECYYVQEGWFNFKKFSQQRDSLCRNIGAERISAKVTDVQRVQEAPDSSIHIIDVAIIGYGIAAARALQYLLDQNRRDPKPDPKLAIAVIYKQESPELTEPFALRRHSGFHQLESKPTADELFKTLRNFPPRQSHQSPDFLEQLVSKLRRVVSKRNGRPNHPNGEIYELTLEQDGGKRRIYARQVINATGCAFGSEVLTELKDIRTAFQTMAAIMTGPIDDVTPAIWMAKKPEGTLCIMPRPNDSGVVITSQTFSYVKTSTQLKSPEPESELTKKIKNNIIKIGRKQIDKLVPEEWAWKGQLMSALDTAEVRIATQFKISTDRFPDLPFELRALASFILLVNLNTVYCTLSTLQIFIPNIIYQILIPVILLASLIPRRAENQQSNHRGQLVFATDNQAREIIIPPVKIQTRTDVALEQIIKACQFPPVSLSQFTALTVIPNEIIINSIFHLLLLPYHFSTTKDDIIQSNEY